MAGPVSAGIVISGGGLALVAEGGSFETNDVALGKMAFAQDVIPAAPHAIANVNDGIYGNSNSWIGYYSGTNTFVGVNLGATPYTLSKVAFGRDNLGIYSDRAIGTYTLQYTTVPNPDATTPDASWTTIGTLDYQSAGGTNFTTPTLRHEFTFTPVSATGVRLKVSPISICIDELELYRAPVFAVLNYYPMGESDAGATAGGTANAFTVDVIGGTNLTVNNAPLYSCDVDSGAALTTGSTLAMSFNAANQYLSGPLLTTATTGYCFEAWAKPNVNSGICPIVFNGDPFHNGLGFVWNNGAWVGLVGGISYFGSAVASPGSWAHLAVVSDQGVCTFYVNGTNAGTFAGAPATPTSSFTIAPALSSHFNGLVDQVRFSTFQPGQFSTNQLLFNGPRGSLPPPTIMAQAATNIEYHAATLTTTVNANNAASQVYLRYGLTSSYGNFSTTNLFGGNCPQTFRQDLTGLTAGTTYHFQTVVWNAYGTNFSVDATFVPAPASPFTTILPASAIGTNSATLNASVYPDGAATSWYFAYGLTTNLGSFSATNVISANLGTTQNVSATLTGLAQNTPYYFVAVAVNSQGTMVSASGSFVTIGFPILDNYPMGESDPGAVAGATMNAITLDTTGTNSLASSNAPTYSCDVAQSAALTANSRLSASFNGVNQFLESPLLTTNFNNLCLELWVKPNVVPVSGVAVVAFNGNPAINGLGLVLNGNRWQVLLGGLDFFGAAPAAAGVWTHLALVGDQAGCHFYVNGTNAGNYLGFPVTPAGAFAIGGNPGGGNNFNGLVDQVRLFSFPNGFFTTNDFLLNSGAVTSLAGPSFISQSVTGLLFTAATLNATVNPNRADTQVYFRYGPTASYGSFSATNVVGGGCQVSASAVISGLTGGATYHYQTVVSNALGSMAGADATFTLVPNFPLATTMGASAVSTNTATLNAAVLPDGLPTTVKFQYGLSTNFGYFTASTLLNNNLATTQAVTMNLTGLTNGGLYYCQVVASNSAGITLGNITNFNLLGIYVSDYYPMGEADAGAVVGGTVSGFTSDAVGSKPLTSSTAPRYSCDVSQAAALAANSSLAMSFDGVNQTLTGPLLTSATTGYCLEAWVKPNTNSGTCPIVFNGDPFHNGLGFVWQDGSWVGLLGGITYFGGVTATPGSWSHVAVVNDQGVSTLYVNGVNAGTYGSGGAGPTSGFTIASTLSSRFNGLIDQVRFSTFQLGQFSTNQLLFNAGPVITLASPAILSIATNGLTSYAINLNMTASPNRADAQCFFRYGQTAGYGSATATNLVDGSCSSSLVFPVNGLTPSTTYHYQAVLVTSLATNVTTDATFTTLPPIPVLTLLPATGVNSNNATLNAGVVPEGAPTSVYFQYGLTASYGSFTPTNQFTTNLLSNHIASMNITGLPAATFFHYQVVASNLYGVVTGADQFFHTAGVNLSVGSLADDGGATTLRGAILAGVSGDRITFSTNGVIKLSQGELVITNNLTIIGTGPANVTISGERQSRVFVVATGAVVSVTGLTITNGLGLPGPGYGGKDGGGIYNGGNLTLSNCVIIGNTAGPGAAGADGTPGDGVEGGPGAAGSSGGSGGGIYNAGSLYLMSCQITGNTSGLGGTGGAGGFCAYLDFHPGIFPGTGGPGGGGGAGGSGGGIGNAGSLAITMSSLFGNNAGLGGTGGSGGSCNAAASDGIAGNSPNGQPAGNGGFGGQGGAIFNFGIVGMTNSTLAGNFAGGGGQGGAGGSSLGISYYARGHGYALYGGSGGNGGNNGLGGGIESSKGILSLVACTVVNNGNGQVGTGGAPGFCVTYGTYGAPGISGFDSGGGGGLSGGGTLLNTIVAQNFGTNVSLATDIDGPFVSQGHNLIGVTNVGTGFVNGSNNDLCGDRSLPLNPQLGALANNGGPTPTCALLSISPAIDAGDSTLLNSPFNINSDQRGQPRWSGVSVDIGAYELQVPPPIIATNQPVVSSPSFVDGAGKNQVTFSFTNVQGASFTVLTSTNIGLPMSNWTAIWTVTNSGGGVYRFTDTVTTNARYPNARFRFYRIRSP